MSTVNARSVRLQCDLGKPDTVLDRRTNLPPAVVRGAAARFEIALFLNGAIVADVSNYDSATLRIRALSDAGVIGAVQASKAIPGNQITACTLQDWNAGIDEHAAFQLSSAELSLAAGTYWLIIAGQTSLGETIVWAAGKLVVIDRGLTDDDAPPVDVLPRNGPLVKRGRVTFAPGDFTKRVNFTTAFAAAPSQILLTPFFPESGEGFDIRRRSGHDAAGFDVDAPVGVPDAGYGFDWIAIL